MTTTTEKELWQASARIGARGRESTDERHREAAERFGVTTSAEAGLVWLNVLQECCEDDREAVADIALLREEKVDFIAKIVLTEGREL